MAFGFIKKVFTFGKDKPEEEEKPETQEQDAADEAVAPVEDGQAEPEQTRPETAPEPKPDEEPVAEEPAEAREVAEEAPVVPAHEAAPIEESAPAEEVEPEVEPEPEADAFIEAEALEEIEQAAETAASIPTAEDDASTEDQDQSDDVSADGAGVIVGAAVERRAAPEAVEPEPEVRKPWFQRLREGLSRSSRELRESISGIFTKRKLDEDTLQDLEDVLLKADLGLETAMRVTDALSSGRYGKNVSGEEVQAIMADEIEKVLAPVARPLELDLSHKPHVILVVGVNGTGKTTTIGKLAAKLTAGGLKVTLAAGDTFRAAAIEQLKIWGERTNSPVVASRLGADAAGLAYDAFDEAKRNGSDVLIIDTAGRLQNKTELMAELEKVVRVLGKHDPEAPHTVLQTVDATTGQNALNQVEIFRNVAGVNGLVMTKLDGTARGGILVSIAAKHKLPVYFIGVGEGVEDLEPFSAEDFAKAIAGIG